MKNRALELHDSEIKLISSANGLIELLLDAYVHESDGVPGVDSGTGWIQPVSVKITAANMAQRVTTPITLTDGELKVGSMLLQNCIPLPYHATGGVDFMVQTVENENLRITGSAIDVESIGTAKFVEEFKAAR
jgi:hypothetical protein